MHAVGLALEELLVTAQKQDCLTVGIYESAKLLNTWVNAAHSDFRDQARFAAFIKQWETHPILLSPPPQRPRQCGAVRPGCGWCRRRGPADPLHPAPVLLLRQRAHHPAGVRSPAAAAAAAWGCGRQQEPGGAQRPALHAGDGELTPHLCNCSGITSITAGCFDAVGQMLIHALQHFSELLSDFL